MERNILKSSGSPVELPDIVDPSYLQAMVDAFSDDTGLACGILDDKARPITFERNLRPFCEELRMTKTGLQQCRASDRHGMELAQEHVEATGKAEPVPYMCKQGLIDFCAPIIVGGEIIAYLFAGEFRCSCEGLETPNEPILTSLLHIASETKKKPNTKALKNKFADMDVLPEAEFNRIKEQVTALARQLNSVVQKLHKWHRLEVVNDFMVNAVAARTVEGLFDVVINSLPGIMQARHCSIFTVQWDENAGRDRLVLRKTSYPNLKPEENSAYYEKGEGLTGWVWKHARSLMIINVRDAAEIAEYDDLKWEHKHPDSDEDADFLGVPMLGRGGEVIGVIRLPQKETIGTPFFKSDEIFLNFLADHLAWVIQCQTEAEKFESAVGPLSLSDAAQRLAKGLSYSEVLDAAIESSEALFGSKGKKHFVNLLEPDGEHWRVERIGGDMALKAGWKQRVFHVNEGFTGLVIRERKAFLSSDLEESLHRGQYVASTEYGVSCISAPICWSDEIYGAISIASDKKFGFLAEKELKLLEALGQLMGAALRNARYHENVMFQKGEAFSSFAKVIRHSLLNALLPVEQKISAMERITDKKSPISEHIESCQNSLNQLQNLLLHLKKITFPSEPSLRSEDLNKIAMSVIDRMYDPHIETRLSPEVLPVTIDPYMLEVILYELLTNALRHIPQESGKVIIFTKLAELDMEGKKCVVEVCDNGPGIAPDEKEKIFLDGYRGKEEEEGEEEHFGIGLFLARQLVTAMGGEIAEKGEYKKGARFIVTLLYKS